MTSLKAKVAGTLRALVSIYGLIFAVIGVFAVAATVGTGIAPIDEAASDVMSSVDDQVSGMNETEVEQKFLQLLNEERRERGLQPLQQRDILTRMGESHSDVMARVGEIGHIEPDGDTIEDRFRQRGLLPECRMRKSDTRRYYPGAENVAQTWLYQDLEPGDGGPTYISTEEELARALFKMWMNSEGHREAMLVPSASQAGLGLNITPGNKVYASLELCG